MGTRQVSLVDPSKLTERQAEIYQWIFEFTMDHGYQPSYSEVCEHFDFCSRSAVGGYLKAIARKGWIVLPFVSGLVRIRAIQFLYCPDGTRFCGFEPRYE